MGIWERLEVPHKERSIEGICERLRKALHGAWIQVWPTVSVIGR